MFANVLQVLPRLIALPDSVATAAQKAAWNLQLQQLPPLASGPALHTSVDDASVTDARSGPEMNYNKDKIYPIATGEGFPTTGPGQRSNSENAELYVHQQLLFYATGHLSLNWNSVPLVFGMV